MKTLLKMLRRSYKDTSRLTPREIRRLRVEPEFIDMVQTSNAIDKFSEKIYTTYKSVEEWETLNTEDGNLMRYAGLDEVRNDVCETGYPKERFHFVQGDIKETVPNNRHKKIALLRLDTDWYELTKHELVHMYDLVSPRGVLIIDDYGSHEGARKAVDEFFAGQGLFPLLFRTNKNERATIKTM